MKPILEIKNISKKFHIRNEQQPYLSLRDSISSILHRNKNTNNEEFWALKDISFDVFPGESVGIIGKNGAGKSTFLKILSKITPPTEGKIISRGRIASLLEVGTGFHPELSGRENIFLNGSILGMKKKEIQNKFDEIVDFSDVEKFLDTPLKHYSSGMQLRLAFAVAAFLEPEILVIDEVLAVGDAEFQSKCLGKMENVTKSGRTVLFVSHNLSAVEVLCTKAVLLFNGKLTEQGSPKSIIESYLLQNNLHADHNDGIILLNNLKRENELHIMEKVEIYCNANISTTLYMGCELMIKIFFNSGIELKNVILGIVLKDIQNVPIIGINNKHYLSKINDTPVTKGVISILIPYVQLMHGRYYADLYFGDYPTDLEVIKNAFTLTIKEKDFTGTGYLPAQQFNRFFIKDVKWEIETL